MSLNNLVAMDEFLLYISLKRDKQIQTLSVLQLYVQVWEE
jgi:hypothetical protein